MGRFVSITRAISSRFGSKRGFLAYMVGQWFLAVGSYRRLQHPDFSRVKRVVFVCHGNICRSAMGDAYAHSLNLNTISCGLHASPGKPADPRAVAYASAHGLDLAIHRSQRADQVSFQSTDLVVAMEPAHINDLEPLVGDAQLTLLGMWLSSPMAYLHDPYSAPPEYFERCMYLVGVATKALAGNIR